MKSVLGRSLLALCFGILSHHALGAGDASENCRRHLLQVELVQLRFRSETDALTFVDKLSAAPDTYGPLFTNSPDTVLRLKEALAGRSAIAHQYAHDRLKHVPGIEALVKVWGYANLPPNILAPVPAGIFARTSAQQTPADLAYLDELLQNVGFHSLSRRIRQVAIHHPELSPQLKRQLGIQMIQRFNVITNLDFVYSDRFIKSDEGDYFLCSEACSFMIVFAKSGQVFLGEYRKRLSSFDTSRWDKLLEGLTETLP